MKKTQLFDFGSNFEIVCTSGYETWRFLVLFQRSSNRVEVPWFGRKINSLCLWYSPEKIIVFSIAMLDSHRVNNLDL